MTQPGGLSNYKAFGVFLGILNLILDIPPLLLLRKLRVLGNFGNTGAHSWVVVMHETIMSQTRVLLLRVPEVLVVKTGKRVNPSDPYPWFVHIEVETMDKLAICQDDPYYIKYREEVLKPNISEQESTAFEMEPRKDVKYS
jgi:hypothetical protein